jgi:hypothetical protein
MTFRIGQRVVCVDVRGWKPRMWKNWNYPNKGDVYTIREILADRDGLTCVRLVELLNRPGINFQLNIVDEPFFGGFRFRPVKETDISIFTAMLAPTPKQKQRVTTER